MGQWTIYNLIVLFVQSNTHESKELIYVLRPSFRKILDSSLWDSLIPDLENDGNNPAQYRVWVIFDLVTFTNVDYDATPLYESSNLEEVKNVCYFDDKTAFPADLEPEDNLGNNPLCIHV